MPHDRIVISAKVSGVQDLISAADIATLDGGFLARVTGPPTLKRLDVLRAAEAEARSARRGLWSVAPR